MPTCSIRSFNLASPATGDSGQRGFTLLEILVVVLIVAIMSGVVLANLPSFARQGDFDAETLRLKTLLALARQEATLQTSELGFKPERQGYGFYQFDDLRGRWQPFEAAPFGPRRLDPALRLTVSVESSDLRLGAADETDESIAPPILILSSGEITPFELTLEGPQGQLRTLVADGYGALRWQSGDADAP